MKKAVFLNSAKLDFDGKLDYASLTGITEFTKYDDSRQEEILERVQGMDIVITKELPVGRDLIMQFPDTVKVICEAGTGYNNIDIEAAREKGIHVCNVPSYSTEAVAQLAITFVLNLSASLMIQQSMLQRGNFDNFTKALQVPHFEVAGKTFGAIGAGAIGQATIKLALALGMKVLVHNRSAKPLDGMTVTFVSLEELLAQSDFISVHCPLTPATKHLINKETLKLVKPSAYIINTSRGAIIKEEDLIEALREGRLAGAALDVQEVEPPALDNPLFFMDNVIITPHIGWRRIESRQRLVNLTADNIAAFSAGKPVNVVN